MSATLDELQVGGDGGEGNQIHRARIASDPVSPLDQVYVVIPDFSEEQKWGPCPWPARGAMLPEAGDKCLILLDNTDAPWVVNWWPERTATTDPDEITPGANGSWLRTAGGAVVWDPNPAVGGVLSGTLPNPGFAVDMATQAELNAEGAARLAHAALTTAAHGGLVSSADARLTDTRTPSDGSVTTAKFAASAKAPDADKLDSIDSLGFARLIAAANVKWAYGVATLTWPGGGQGSNALNIAHGLGVVPIAYWAMIEGIANPDYVYASAAATSTNIQLAGWNAGGIQGAGNKNVFWLAVG